MFNNSEGKFLKKG